MGWPVAEVSDGCHDFFVVAVGHWGGLGLSRRGRGRERGPFFV